MMRADHLLIAAAVGDDMAAVEPLRRARRGEAKSLAEINSRNLDHYGSTPLPRREPSKDGREIGGVIDERMHPHR